MDGVWVPMAWLGYDRSPQGIEIDLLHDEGAFVVILTPTHEFSISIRRILVAKSRPRRNALSWPILFGLGFWCGRLTTIFDLSLLVFNRSNGHGGKKCEKMQCPKAHKAQRTWT